MRIGQEYILHPDELSDAMASLETIRDAFDLRRDTLTGTSVTVIIHLIEV